MDGTRKGILGDINTWVKDPGTHKICWLTGRAGTGKSSIAKTICMEAKRDAAVVLGGSFFCSRSSGWAAQRDIRCVVSTLVQILALESSEFQQVLVEHIDSGIQYKEAAVQVEQLLHMPLLALDAVRGAILFVIDARDECGGETSGGILGSAASHDIVASMLETLVRNRRHRRRRPQYLAGTTLHHTVLTLVVALWRGLLDHHCSAALTFAATAKDPTS